MRKLKIRFSVSVAFLLLVTLFQNCSPFSAVPTGLDSSSLSISPTATPSPIDFFSTDRTLFFGKSRCQRMLFCDDFETGLLTNWSIWGDVPLIDTEEAARGAKALHIKKTGLGFSAVHLSSIFPVINNAYFGRAFVRYKQLPKAVNGYLHWELMGASGTGSSAEVRMGGEWQDGKNRFNTGSDYGPLGDSMQKDQDPASFREVPLNEWMCIEWQHDGLKNETKVWWDGVEHPSMETTLTKHGGPANVPDILPVTTGFYIGWNSHQPSSETYEMFLDEIAIDPARIGCVR